MESFDTYLSALDSLSFPRRGKMERLTHPEKQREKSSFPTQEELLRYLDSFEYVGSKEHPADAESVSEHLNHKCAS
jgi:hypothetical protein